MKEKKNKKKTEIKEKKNKKKKEIKVNNSVEIGRDVNCKIFIIDKWYDNKNRLSFIWNGVNTFN